MDIYRIKEIIAKQKNLNRRYTEFFRIPDVSVGVYRLPAGAQDMQEPHSEEELYYVLDGQGYLQVGEENERVEPGVCAFVPARIPHRFFNITKDLVLLVVFAPAEGTHAGSHPTEKTNSQEE